MGTSVKERYTELLGAMDVDLKRAKPTLENVQWFIHTGYKQCSERCGAVTALDMAYRLQTRFINE